MNDEQMERLIQLLEDRLADKLDDLITSRVEELKQELKESLGDKLDEALDLDDFKFDTEQSFEEIKVKLDQLVRDFDYHIRQLYKAK